MNKFIVYHYNMKDPKNAMVFFSPDKCDLSFPNNYEVVAIVESETIDSVFHLTNNIDDSWTKNKEVCAVRPSIRSTSVGDVVVDSNGKRFLCMSAGWKEI
jgi:hypothetical protein